MPDETLYFEDWQATYGSPYLIDDETAAGEATVVEDGPFARNPAPSSERSCAFVDGVRRGEGTLYRRARDGAMVRGVAGAHACGAVICVPGGPACFGDVQTRRLVIFGAGDHHELPAVDGYSWHAASIASTDPDAPLAELQTRMRGAEGRLAERLAADGHLTVTDGPLNFVLSRDLPIVGYIKTHHRALLVPAQHSLVPGLLCGQRTPLFALGRDRYSAYTRISDGGPLASPWHGIVRLELAQSFGLAAAARLADEVTAMLPRFAGIAHRDPRAPQNLQPIGALERHLRRYLGPSRLATRAVRLAIAQSRSRSAT